MPLDTMKEYTLNYQKGGGKKSFSDYYSAKYDRAVVLKRYRQNVVFSRHNLAIDGSFNEFNVICCRNVMIYFNEVLRERVLKLLYNSLCRFGILILGNKESLQFSDIDKHFKLIDRENLIYQRID